MRSFKRILILVVCAVSDQLMELEMQYEFRRLGPQCYATVLIYEVIIDTFTASDKFSR
jgi:hypothetical protein